MRYQIKHTTRYRYSAAASLGHNQACLLPRHTGTQRCLKATLTVRPTPALQHERLDRYGNRVHYFEILSPHEELLVSAVSRVETAPPPPPPDSPCWRQAVDEPELIEFALPSPLTPVDAGVYAFARPSFAENRPLLRAAADLCRRIHENFEYDPSSTSVVTPLAELLRLRRGVCQDFAHLFLACMRAYRLPARYVSGYLETLPPPGQPKLRGSDASHAWVAVALPGGRWADFDPTNRQLPDERYVTISWGRDYADVTPLKGVLLGGGEHRLEVAVDVVRDRGEPGTPETHQAGAHHRGARHEGDTPGR